MPGFESVERHQTIPWPDSELGRSKVVLWLLEQTARDPDQTFGLVFHFSTETNGNSALRDFNDIAVEPLIDYLDERLAAETDLIYLFERYRRRVLWFEQQGLWDRYQADTRRGEAVYDEDLRKFLFEQGVDFPFSQVEGPSGKPDITLIDESDTPLPVEVKLFDGERYGTSYLAKGFGQALRYSQDYDQPGGYLVVFNLTDKVMEIKSDDPEAGWPPRINIDHRTIFIIVVQAAPRPSASSAGRPSVYHVTRAELVG